MSQGIFEYRDYKRYLAWKIGMFPKSGRGVKARLANHLGCQQAYVSQVLSIDHPAQFSLEQAAKANDFFSHTQDESDYFLLLVQCARAGSVQLQTLFSRQISEAQERQLVLKNRLKSISTIDPEVQATYFSSWKYGAIHAALSIPEFQIPARIAQRLELSIDEVRRGLDFLVACGLAKQSKGRYLTGTARFHLGSDSPMINHHHANWRLKAIQSAERRAQSGVPIHYSSVVTLSKADLVRLKSRMIQVIEEFKSEIRNSKEEELCGFNLDFYEL